MASKKRKAKKSVVTSIFSLRARAALILRKQKTNTEKFRRKIAKNKGEFPFPTTGCGCDLCKASRLIRRADRLSKA
jgi:hypothetical protein